MSDSDSSEGDAKLRGWEIKRQQFVHNEIDTLIADAITRSASVDNKGSFLAVASGVIIAAISQTSWKVDWYLPAVPITLAAFALLLAAWALRPASRAGVTPAMLSDRWLDSMQSPITMERIVIREKVAMASLREIQIKSRANTVVAGFIFLIVAIFALVIIYSFNLA